MQRKYLIAAVNLVLAIIIVIMELVQLQLVLSTGNGVNGFTLDPSLGEFIFTHPNIKVCMSNPTHFIDVATKS